MKKALTAFEDLMDGFRYTADSWLRLDLAEATFADASLVAGASAFLFDNLFAKENAGAELTAAVAQEFPKGSFDPNALSAMATKIRLAMVGNDFYLGSSPLRDYLKWISDAEPTVMEGYLDDYGRLVLLTAEEFTNLIVKEENVHDSPMHVAELVFLTTAERFSCFYRDLLGLAEFRMLKSYAFFESIDEQMERIRREIVD